MSGLLLAFLLAAQQPAGVPAERGALAGVVLNGQSGGPLARARVTLNRAEGRQSTPAIVITDSSGRFLFEHIEPGRYRLSVQRNGFVDQQYGARRPGRPGFAVVVGSGQTLRDLSLRMTPQAVITGRVLEEEGEPALGVSVALLRVSWVRGRRELTPAISGSTNDLGEYRLHGVAPGRYFVTAAPRVRAAVGLGYPPLYYPNTDDPASAVSIELTPGELRSGIDFMLRRVPTVRIRGRVDFGPSPPERTRVAVQLLPRSGAPAVFRGFPTAVTDHEGNFEIPGVVPGSYTLMARAGNGRLSRAALRGIDVGHGDLEGILLSLSEGADVAGRVQIEGSDASPRGVHIMFRPVEMLAMGMQSVRPDEAGTFRAQRVVAGRYEVQVSGLPPDHYVNSIRLGDHDVLANGLDLTLGPVSEPLDVVLSGTAGQLDGIVGDAKNEPVVGATVVLVPESSARARYDRYRETTTDQYGHFVLRGIAPGEYKLFAWEDVEPGAWYDPDFLKSQESLGESVSVGENSRRSIQLRVVSP